MLPLYGACAFSITTCDERRKLSSNLLRSTFLLCVSRHRARKDQDQSEIIFSAAIWSHGKTSGQVGFLTLLKSQNEFLGRSPHPIIRRQPIAAYTWALRCFIIVDWRANKCRSKIPPQS